MGLDILKANLPGKLVERKPSSTFGVRDHAGYWTRIGGKKIYVAHARQFRAWFKSASQFNAVMRSLGAKSASPRWPDGSNVRCVEFLDPFPETNPTVARKGLRTFRARKGDARRVRLLCCQAGLAVSFQLTSRSQWAAAR